MSIINKDEIKNVAEKAKDKAKKCLYFIDDNKNVIIAVTPLVMFAAKTAVSQYNTRKLDRRVWDPSMGLYYITKKRMKEYEKVEFATRVHNGENRAQVLRDMGLL